jgi:hypothetical protein
VEVLHISEELYQYLYTQYLQINNITDVYSEPVQVYSNIDNALGIFASASMEVKYLKFESKPN